MCSKQPIELTIHVAFMTIVEMPVTCIPTYMSKVTMIGEAESSDRKRHEKKYHQESKASVHQSDVRWRIVDYGLLFDIYTQILNNQYGRLLQLHAGNATLPPSYPRRAY